MNGATKEKRPRGAPLIVIGLLVTLWVAGRASVWENPFPANLLPAPLAEELFAQGGDEDSGFEPAASASISDSFAIVPRTMVATSSPLALLASAAGVPEYFAPSRKRELRTEHNRLWYAALGSQSAIRPTRASYVVERPETFTLGPAAPLPPQADKPDRWSVDAWGFWREGSNAMAISQGRVPVYGASQIGAKLDYRAAPDSRFDPRLYARAYRALVQGGETELAAGASALPVKGLPIRLAAEMRVTENRFGTELRPAAYAVTELPAQDLIAGFRLEAYGGAGYVGGGDATAFADGQVTVTKELASFEGPSDSKARLSLGGGAWGGAQSDASRVDVGPTVRLDLTLGDVPARLSVDWRERVGGDAAPDSGIAATLSTRF